MKTDKELYQIFSVDICTQSYAIEFTLIGAIDKDDLVKHLPDILKEMGISKENIKKLKKWYKGDDGFGCIEIIDGAYTDKPYEPLSTYAYYE